MKQVLFYSWIMVESIACPTVFAIPSHNTWIRNPAIIIIKYNNKYKCNRTCQIVSLIIVIRL